MTEFHIQKKFDAPRDKVFAACTDHAGMSEWVEGANVTVETPGEPAPNGLGAVRKIALGPLAIRERITGWDDRSRMEYVVISGAPLHDHLGVLRFEDDPSGGTRLDYTVRFRVPWYFGGGVVEGFVASQLKSALEKGLGVLDEKLRAAA